MNGRGRSAWRAEAGYGESCGLAMPAEEQQLWLLRGLQGRPTYALDEGLT
jgi:hypothetical protein